MPTIALQSKVRTASEHCSLSLNIRHRLLLGQPSDLVFDMKPAIPEAVDVLLFSNLLITVSGSLDGTRITPAELKTSHLANHLVDSLQTNAGELGISAVSELHISEDTHLLSLTLTPSRHFPTTADTLPVHLKLIALDLNYVWQTNSNATGSDRLDATINPFSRHLSLPYLTATDNAVGRFVTFHLVRRYPLIFGPWCKQLDVECSFFPSIISSIQSIMKRSHNPVFQATCQSLFKLCKGQIMSSSVSTAGELSKYLGLEAGAHSAPVIYTHNEEEAFFLCLERFYRLGMKRPKFRHLSLFPVITSSEDLLSDTLVTLDAFDVNYPSDQSSKASGLLPHVSLFEGTNTDESSDLELNTEDVHRVTPSNSYEDNNAPQESLDQIYHLIDTAFDTKWAEISDQDLCDNIYDLSEDDSAGSYGTFWQSANDHTNSDLAVDSDINCLLEEPDGSWQISTRHDWSPDSLSSQEHDQDSLGKVSSPGAIVQPLKMPTSLYISAALEDILDPLHLGHNEYGLPDLDHLHKHNLNALANPRIVPYEGSTLTSLAQIEDITQASPVFQEHSSGDDYFELESDIQIDLTPNLVSKPLITDGDHGIMAFDFAPKSPPFISRSGAQALFSDQHSGQPMCGYGEPVVCGENWGVTTDDDCRFLAIEYDSDVAT